MNKKVTVLLVIAFGFALIALVCNLGALVSTIMKVLS